MRLNIDKVALISIVKLAFVLVLSIVLGTFLFTLIETYVMFDAFNTLAIWFTIFISSLILRINYANKILFLDLLLATFLVSYYSFGQGLIIMILLLLSQKILKVL